MTDSPTSHSGGCQCGTVRFKVTGALRGVVNCHCNMCRRLHGVYGAYTKIDNAALAIIKARSLAWYESSHMVRRGFCRECGASLFWQQVGSNTTSIAAGSLDQPSGLKTIGHIFAAERADFYVICDDLTQFLGSAGGVLDTTGA